MENVIEYKMPRYKIGTQFIYIRMKAEIVGYHIEHTTDDNTTVVSYRVKYRFPRSQKITSTISMETVNMAIEK